MVEPSVTVARWYVDLGHGTVTMVVQSEGGRFMTCLLEQRVGYVRAHFKRKRSKRRLEAFIPSKLLH